MRRPPPTPNEGAPVSLRRRESPKTCAGGCAEPELPPMRVARESPRVRPSFLRAAVNLSLSRSLKRQQKPPPLARPVVLVARSSRATASLLGAHHQSGLRLGPRTRAALVVRHSAAAVGARRLHPSLGQEVVLRGGRHLPRSRRAHLCVLRVHSAACARAADVFFYIIFNWAALLWGPNFQFVSAHARLRDFPANVSGRKRVRDRCALLFGVSPAERESLSERRRRTCENLSRSW